jgi:hypothetical protein
MPLGTLDRTPPPFFKQGPSALSKLMVFSAVALFLMVADTRFAIVKPLRAALATAESVQAPELNWDESLAFADPRPTGEGGAPSDPDGPSDGT